MMLVNTDDELGGRLPSDLTNLDSEELRQFDPQTTSTIISGVLSRHDPSTTPGVTTGMTSRDVRMTSVDVAMTSLDNKVANDAVLANIPLLSSFSLLSVRLFLCL